MVLVASSRSARTALPSEQNQPGRRLEQAAHPTGACRAVCFCCGCAAAEFSVCALVLLLLLSVLLLLGRLRTLFLLLWLSPLLFGLALLPSLCSVLRLNGHH